jgi:hypothetical protein
MMPDFVDHHVRDQRFQRLAAFDPFVEQSAAIKVDHVGHAAAVIDRFHADRPPAIEAGELERILDPQCLQRLVIGEVFDAEHDIAQMPAKCRGQARHRRAGDRLNCVGIGCETRPCDLTEPHHPRDIEPGRGSRQQEVECRSWV